MAKMPESVRGFLEGRRFAVAGVSRSRNQPANAVFRRLVASGYEVLPVNPRASELEGVRCYESLLDVPGPLDGVVIATPPTAALDLVRQCAEKRVGSVWLHRSFGAGSVSEEAVEECERLSVKCIPGGCPMMFCEPVDLGHRCMRWWLQRKGLVPR